MNNQKMQRVNVDVLHFLPFPVGFVDFWDGFEFFLFGSQIGPAVSRICSFVSAMARYLPVVMLPIMVNDRSFIKA